MSGLVWLGKAFRASVVSNDGETFQTLSWEREKAKGKLETKNTRWTWREQEDTEDCVSGLWYFS